MSIEQDALNQHYSDEFSKSAPDTTKDTGDRLKTISLTFGQKAVGLLFNPSNDDDAVGKCKQGFADLIDQMDTFRNNPEATPGQKRHASIAITDIETAQMRAVKALTWKD